MDSSLGTESLLHNARITRLDDLGLWFGQDQVLDHGLRSGHSQVLDHSILSEHQCAQLVSPLLDALGRGSMAALQDDAMHFKAHRFLYRLICRTITFPPSKLLENLTLKVTTDREFSISGGSGCVYKGVYESQTVAIKAFRSPRNSGLGENTLLRDKAFYKEFLALSSLDHQFVIPCLGLSDPLFNVQSPCIIFPWYKHGSVAQVLRISQEHLPRWVYELVEGMVYLHGRNVIHGDLKGSNILLDDDYHVRIADFGLSRFAKISETMSQTSGGSTLGYEAPEMVPRSPVQFSKRFPILEIQSH